MNIANTHMSVTVVRSVRLAMYQWMQHCRTWKVRFSMCRRVHFCLVEFNVRRQELFEDYSTRFICQFGVCASHEYHIITSALDRMVRIDVSSLYRSAYTGR
jgi:hypothetical protein